MDGLKALDHVAYIRFASVYKDFSEPGISTRSPSAVERKRDAATSAVSPPPVIVLVRPQLGAEYRQGGAGDAQFRADRAAAGRAARRLAQSRRRARRRAAPTSCSSRRRCSTASPEAVADCSTVYATTVRRRDLVMPVVDAGGDGARDRGVSRRARRSCSGPSARGSRPRMSRSPARSSPCRSIPNSARSTSPRR